MFPARLLAPGGANFALGTPSAAENGGEGEGGGYEVYTMIAHVTRHSLTSRPDVVVCQPRPGSQGFTSAAIVTTVLGFPRQTEQKWIDLVYQKSKQ